ncbi:MAG: hypothetical protein QJR06_01970 [Alicyclobacillaceae bacterium]|nr:hypothetical protein [Alicyclobacillaceae bacterium]
MEENTKKWYLRPMVILALIVITPPIGYLNVLVNRKRFKPEEWLGYLTVATVFTALWLTKFLPKEWAIPTIRIESFVERL